MKGLYFCLYQDGWRGLLIHECEGRAVTMIINRRSFIHILYIHS